MKSKPQGAAETTPELEKAMIPKNSRYCTILLASAQFGQHKVITNYGRELAQQVAADYNRLKTQLEGQFGERFLIRTGAFQAAVATANLAFDGRGHLTTDARLGTVAHTRQSANNAMLRETFLDSDCRLAVVCGQKSAFVEIFGAKPELHELRSCQALIVFIDSDYHIISTQVLVPEATVFRRDGWRRRIPDLVARQRLAA